METGTFELVGLIITLVMTCFVVKSCRRAGIVKRCVAGAGFFTAACYLDMMIGLIMEGLGIDGAGRHVLGILAVAVSKSIMVSGLILGKVISSGRQEEDGICVTGSEAGAAGSKTGLDGIRTGKACSETGVNVEKKPDRKKLEFDYMTGLAFGVTLFFMVLAPGIFGWQESVERRFAAVAFLLGSLLLFYASLLFYQRKRRMDGKQADALNRKREADAYLENVENNYQRTRELWHDLKNHINLLNMLLLEGKYEQMADYLKVFGEDVDSLTLPVKSGNIIVDALLEDKSARARKQGVEVRLSLCNLTALELKPDEICGLLGNLLDNALEANRQVKEGKFLEIECREQAEFFYIRVRNAAAGKAWEEGGILQSAKADRYNRVGHGLGLRSAERIVHGCGGELVIDSREKEFTVVARLPRGAACALHGCRL